MIIIFEIKSPLLKEIEKFNNELGDIFNKLGGEGKPRYAYTIGTLKLTCEKADQETIDKVKKIAEDSLNEVCEEKGLAKVWLSRVYK